MLWGLSLSSVALMGLVLGLGACSVQGSYEGGGNVNGSSPTGTFLSPRERDGTGAHGYDVLDEACEDVLDPRYLERFETPMFRGVTHHGGVAHLVDGGHLWSVSLLDPTYPRRLSRVRLPGHPLKIASDERGRLYVAAGEAGLHVLSARDATDMGRNMISGEVSAAAPRLLTTTATPGLALDVALLLASGPADASPVEDPAPAQGGLERVPSPTHAVVASGAEGLTVLELPDSEASEDGSAVLVPEVVATLPLPGFATAVAIEGRVAWVAACRTLVVVDLTDPSAPTLMEAYSVPHGHAKGIFVKDAQVLVAGGEALFVYDGLDPLEAIWIGYYAEPTVPGFYVNDVVARDGIAYIAAGDEAVRSVDLRHLSPTDGYPAAKAPTDGAPLLEGAAELPPAREQPGREPVVIVIRKGDPIGVGLVGDLLMVLGNFRWLGERTLRLLRVDGTGQMVDVASYLQPEHILGVSAVAGAIVGHGGEGAEVVFPTLDATPWQFSLPSPAERWAADPEGIWFLTEAGGLVRWDQSRERELALAPSWLRGVELASRGPEEVFVVDRAHDRIVRVNRPFVGSFTGILSIPGLRFPGDAVLAVGPVYLYAYEWVTGVLHVLRGDGLSPDVLPRPLRLGVCEAYDIADFFSGRSESSVRLALKGDRLWVLCPHDAQGGSSVLEVDLSQPWAPELWRVIALPPARYTDFALKDDEVYTLAFDNNRYESVLAWQGAEGRVETIFDGAGHGLCLVDDLWHVADADVGLRRFRLAEGVWQDLGVIPLGEEGSP